MASETQANDRRTQRHEARTTATFKAFLKDVMAATDIEDERVATATMSTVLCLLSQRILGEEARDLQAQLPDKIREILTECPIHQGRPREKFNRASLVAQVAEDLQIPADVAEHRVRGVFEVLSLRVSTGEIKQVIHGLPKDYWDLWPKELVSSAEQTGQPSQ